MNALPEPTDDLTLAREHVNEWGYCILSDVMDTDEVDVVRERLLSQKAGEEERGIAYHGPDRKQLIRFLLNKGSAFIDLLFKPQVRDMIAHVLGPAYLFSSYNGHIAHPGGNTAFHTDQFWMPQPVVPGQPVAVKPGAITRGGHRGHLQRLATHVRAALAHFRYLGRLVEFGPVRGAPFTLDGLLALDPDEVQHHQSVQLLQTQVG